MVSSQILKPGLSTRNGKFSILVMKDYFIKALLLKDYYAVFVTERVSCYGCTKGLHMDQTSEFESDLF